jgi:putative oxidoreductase
MKFLNALQPLSILLLRATIGILFITHGYPKLMHGASMQAFFVAHGLPGYFVYVSGILEVFGGGLLILGLFARPAALLLAIEMGVAIWKVHSGHGLFAVNDYGFPLLLGAASLTLATIGASAASLDHLIFGGGKSRTARPPKK